MSPAAPAAEDRAAPLEDAARLLALAMHESHAPVEALAGALERMAAALAQCAPGLGREGRERLEREIALCIESLQFHDRLIQRLERVSRALGDGGSAAPDPLCGAAAAQGTIELFE